MNRGAPPQKGRQKVSLRRKAVIRIPRKVVEAPHRALGIVAHRPVGSFVGEAGNVFEIAMPANRLEQFEERLFSLTAHRVVHVARIQRGRRVVGREIASPNNWQAAEIVARISRQLATAPTVCGPGITVTARSSTGCSLMMATRVSVGCGSRLPSTMAYSSLPSTTAAIARIDSGNRRLRGLVAFGL